MLKVRGKVTNMKIVINAKYGGFGLSETALALYKARKHLADDEFSYFDLERNDPVLVEIVEKLGEDADDLYSKLKVVEIPDDIKCWEIVEYDGCEHIAECHRKFS